MIQIDNDNIMISGWVCVCACHPLSYHVYISNKQSPWVLKIALHPSVLQLWWGQSSYPESCTKIQKKKEDSLTFINRPVTVMCQPVPYLYWTIIQQDFSISHMVLCIYKLLLFFCAALNCNKSSWTFCTVHIKSKRATSASHHMCGRKVKAKEQLL